MTLPQGHPAKVRVLLADDHEVVRAGYRFLLESVDDLQVVAEAESGEAAVQSWFEHRPDVLVLDLTMPGIGGMEAIRRIRQQDAQARILVFTMHDSTTLVAHALQAGVSGYITKTCTPDTLVMAVRRIAAGQTFIEPELAQHLVVQQNRDRGSPIAGLSTRELQILCMFAEARTVEEIGAALSLSTKTISNYLTQIKDKLKVQSSTELVKLAIGKGLVSV